MRLAQVMAGAPTGGAELFFERLSAALARHGDAVLPVIRRNPARAARLRADGLAPVQLGFGGLLDILTRPRLARLLRRFAPDVVLAWMSRAARHTPRGDWALVGRLGGYYAVDNFARCDHLVANTRGLAEWIVAQGVAADRVHHVPNFAPDLGGQAPQRLGVPAGHPLLLGLGRLHRNKGFDILIRALPRLPGAHAIIAGEGPERDALTELARREGVADRVLLPGWRSDTGALLAGCDVFVCASRQEPLGNMVIEAFSAGRPVVACAAAGPRELIVPGETGMLVPVDDAPALALAAGSLLDHPALAVRLATAARATFEAEHAEAPVLARWQRFLASVRPGQSGAAG
jgi:glycosyltransferase involved in cell wall biosynthesis